MAKPTTTERIRFDATTSRFQTSVRDDEIPALAAALPGPMSVILQITRRCHLDCAFCSEPEPIPDPSLSELAVMRDHLAGVPRVFLSGGEPLIRKDFPQILDLFSPEFLIGVPTNALASRALIKSLRGRVQFVNIGLDGPRRITSKLRGDYDIIMKGVARFLEARIPLSFTCVVLTSNLSYVPFTAQIADALGATKLKLVYPIKKGNALNLEDDEFLPPETAQDLARDLARLKEECGWKTAITVTPWTKETEGYSILVYPNAETFAWPVFDAPDKVVRLGNLIEDTIQTIWTRYSFKSNHLRKYLGKSIYLI